MRIYQSALPLKRIEYANSRYNELRPNVLFAYNFDSDKNNNDLVELIKNKDMTESLIVDSGMYYINTMPANQRDYFNPEDGFKELCVFYDDFKNDVDFYFSYDFMFSGEVSFDVNKHYFERMLGLGLNPVFVMHTFERYEIDYVKEINPQYVAIASALLKGKKDKINQSIAVTDELYESGIKVHLLGCNSYNILKRSKAWSCDASSYVKWASKGRIIYLSKSLQKEKQLALNEFGNDHKKNKDYIGRDDMKSLKDEYSDFIEQEAGLSLNEIDADNSLAILANSYYMVYLEKLITDIQKKNGVDFTQDKFRKKDHNNIGDW